MRKTIRWGILGAGAVARHFAQGLSDRSHSQLVAVASRTATSAEAFAREFNVPRQHASYDDLVEDAEVDVVYVATPASLHRDHCLRALGSGKPVLCEKPFAVNANEAREVIAEARRRGLFCMEAMWMRFLPAMDRLRELLDRRAIGNVRLLTADLGFASRNDGANRLIDPALGGGAFLDLGVYLVSLSSMLFGQPVAVSGQASIGSTGVDEESAAVLRYSGGELAVLTASIQSTLPGEALIVGTRGQIRVHAPIYRPHRLSVQSVKDQPGSPGTSSGRPSSRLNWARNNRLLRQAYFRFEGLIRPLLHARAAVVAPLAGNGYGYEADEVARCLHSGKTESEIMPLGETLSIMETLDQIRSAWAEAGVAS
jgi:predicted dehydrogenase